VEAISSEFFSALGYLLTAGLVRFAWKTAEDATVQSGWKIVLWHGFLWCGGIALASAVYLGSPSCESYDQAPTGSSCESYADDGFEPTAEDRVGRFAFLMTLFYIPVCLAAIQSRHKYKRSKATLGKSDEEQGA
jgi:hypothetical protein